MTKTPQKNQEKDPSRGRLLRSPSERMVVGVAGGTAKYLGVDPTFVRLGFFVASLFGGFGLLAYLVMAVVVPEDDGTGNPVEGQRPPVWAIAALAVVALLVVPGGFWGWDESWFFGLLCLGFVAGVVVLAYRAFSGRWPGSPAEASGAPDEASGGRDTGARLARVVLYGILVLSGVGIAGALALLGAFATATGYGAIVAGVVVALGIGLAVTAFSAEGSKRAAPWLLAVALVLAIPAGAVAAADVRFEGGIGERSHTPAAAADIPTDGYELGVGQMKIDLRELDIAPGDVVRLPANLGIGQMVVAVPANACVTGHAEAKGGELLVRGDSNSGPSVEFDRAPAPGASLPEVEIDAELQFGQLVVTDRDPEEFGDHNRGPGDGDPDDATDEPAACAG